MLHLPGLGDRQPSKLAAEIIAIVPKGITPGYLERQIFLEQLPSSVQQNMAAHGGVTELRELAKLADGYIAAAHAKMSCTIEQKLSLTPAFGQVQASDEEPELYAVIGGRRPPSSRKLCLAHVKYGT